MLNANALALPSPLSNIQQYQTLVEGFPLLDETEERALAERFKTDNDLDAAWQLTISHLRYVVYIARSYTGYGLPQEDLIQEGNLGLMKAVQRFDPSRGVRLIAYAGHWIRAGIHQFILKNWRIVNIATTKARRKLFYKLRSAKQRLEWLNKAEAQQIADDLNVPPEEVMNMDGDLYLADRSFETPIDDEEIGTPEAFLSDDRFEPETIVAEQEFDSMATTQLHAAMETLDARSRDILASRWLSEEAEKLTLQELGERYDISAERVRQIERAAIKHLREVMTERLGYEQTKAG